jgi:hypothetical protein
MTLATIPACLVPAYPPLFHPTPVVFSPYASLHRPLGSLAPGCLALPASDQLQTRPNRLREPLTLLANLEASLPAATLAELIRDLAGWSVPPTVPASAGRSGTQWLW